MSVDVHTLGFLKCIWNSRDLIPIFIAIADFADQSSDATTCILQETYPLPVQNISISPRGLFAMPINMKPSLRCDGIPYTEMNILVFKQIEIPINESPVCSRKGMSVPFWV
jgi:hypothetical protein